MLQSCVGSQQLAWDSMLEVPFSHSSWTLPSNSTCYVKSGILMYIRVIALIVMGFNVAYLRARHESLSIMFSILSGCHTNGMKLACGGYEGLQGRQSQVTECGTQIPYERHMVARKSLTFETVFGANPNIVRPTREVARGRVEGWALWGQLHMQRMVQHCGPRAASSTINGFPVHLAWQFA